MSATAAPHAAIRDLGARLRGGVLHPGDAGYEAGRRLWNAVPDHRPVGIARPGDAREVGLAVLAAREARLPLAVRGGGHSAAGASMADGGLTIDLGLLRGVEVDVARGRVRVGGGALLADVASACEPHGVCIPYGHVSHTGVGGLTLGGGIGWVMRRHGLAVDRFVGAELVTAEGEVVRVDLDREPELLWALRGGGGNFGVVTSFEFEACPHGLALGGMLLYPLADAPAALRACRDLMAEAPDELTVFETLMTAPPDPAFPEAVRGRPALAVCAIWTGDPARGEQALARLRAIGRPAMDTLGPLPLTAAQSMLDPTAPHGLRYWHRARWLDGLDDGLIDALVDHHSRVTAPMSALILARLGGAVPREPVGGAAFCHRDADRVLWSIGGWAEGDDAEHVAWVRQADELAVPRAVGAYVNGLSDQGAAGLRAAYDDATLTRLRAVKRAWDPENVFALNENIAPA